jgi:uncharacterized LabA/DUF88 family protein
MSPFSYAPLKPTERVMVFIDGGYVRAVYEELFGDDNIDYEGFLKGLLGFYSASPYNVFRPDLVRAYFYDALPSEEDPDYNDLKRYFVKVTRNFFFTVRYGTLVKSEKGERRQKGVDILMSIDALTKAYLNHYDTGIFFLGDRDFVPLIEAVKNTGKKTLGFYFGTETAEGQLLSKVPLEVGKAFDIRIALPKETLEKWHIKNNAK